MGPGSGYKHVAVMLIYVVVSFRVQWCKWLLDRKLYLHQGDRIQLGGLKILIETEILWKIINHQYQRNLKPILIFETK